ncbi:MAG: hypothetical protein OXU77_14355 [Gammaproteobacteria bacterium]|nr:hypothetical protein [Gammaproteobacteria bacterium]
MDFDLGNLLDIAGGVSGTIKDAVSLYTQISKLLKDGKLPADAAESMLALSGQLSDAQVNLARLETEILKMQRAHEALDEIKQRKGNYVLAETATGARIYRLKQTRALGRCRTRCARTASSKTRFANCSRMAVSCFASVAR